MSQSSTSLVQNQFGDIITAKRTQYVQKNETKQIVNGIVELTEVPDSFTKVQVTGNDMQWYETKGAPSGNLYQVDYGNPLVYFDPLYNNVTVSLSYMGTGQKLISSNQIYTALDSNGNVTQTLNDLATNAQTQADNAQTIADSLGFVGQYDASTSYTKNNIVSYNGITYICIVNTTGNDPTNTSYWRKITAFRNMGTYSSAITYSLGDYVTDSGNLNLYMCLQDGISNVPLSDTTNWELLISVAEAVQNANSATSQANSSIASMNTLNTNVTNAENSRVSAENSRVSAENSRVSAENSRVSAESNRVSAETSRTNAESSRVTAENNRTSAETTRSSNETTRQNDESTRQSNETSRVSAESSRVSAENSRADAESSRVSAENTRSSNESTRQTNESTRQSNETTRQNNETARQTAINNLAAQSTTWSNSTAYKARNIVRFSGATYIAIVDNTGYEPDQNIGTKWQLVAQDGANGNGSGTVMSVTSSNGDIAVASSTTNPTLTLNSTTSGVANGILKLDSNSNATASTFTSTVATGTAPFSVSSTTNVPNLNASSLNGYIINQNLRTTDNPTFSGATISGQINATKNGGEFFANSSSGAASYVQNWTSSGYAGIGPNSLSADNTLRIGPVATSSSGAWTTPNGTNFKAFIAGALSSYKNVQDDGKGNIGGNTTSPTYGLHINGGAARIQGLATPSAPTVSQSGTTGTTSYTYYVVAKDQNGNRTLISSGTTTATGNATLSSTNYNTISWTTLSGATSYDVLKGNTTTLLGNTTNTSLNDTGQTTSGYTPPTHNETGDLTVDGMFASKAAQGVAPFSVTSTTQVNNLNANYLNGITADQIFGQRENITSNTSDQYQLVATLPPSGSALDKLFIEIQGSTLTSDSLTCDYYEMSNRPSFNYVYYLSGVDPNNARANYRVVAYKQADNSVQVYLKTLANQSVAAIVSAYSLNLSNNTTALVIGNPSTTVPSGTVVFDSGNSSTYPPNAVIQAGTGQFSTLQVNGNSVATLDGSGKVPTSQIPSLSYVPTSQEGIANGVATLDSNGNVPANQLGNVQIKPIFQHASYWIG